MDAKLVWTIDPLKQAEKLKAGLRNKVIRIAMNKASAAVKEAVIASAPTRYGFLKKSIRIKIKNYRNKAVWVSVVGPKSDFEKNKGKYKRGKSVGEPRKHKPSQYARFLEGGTKRAAARPFLKPALSSSQSQFQSVLADSIKSQVETILSQKA